MSKLLVSMVAVACAVGCEPSPVNTCSVACSADADCPPGQTCGEIGLCTANGATCSCAPGEFISCDDESALFCNAEANGVTMETCGAPGCNADAGRCNACVADTIACSADRATLDHCGADGLVAQSDACAAGCVAGTPGVSADRCGYIEPAWLGGVCDEPAPKPEEMLGGTLDTQQDAACTGGVLDRDGTTFCVVRAARVTVGDLKVTLVWIEGSYKGMAMPGMPANTAKDSYGLLGAAVSRPGQDEHYFMLTGPKKTVDSVRPAFDELVQGLAPRG